MRTLVIMIVSLYVFVNLALGQPQRMPPVDFDYHAVGPVAPIDSGMFVNGQRKQDGVISFGDRRARDDRKAFVAFGTDPRGDMRSDRVRYLTFYLRPSFNFIEPFIPLTDVIVSSGVSFRTDFIDDAEYAQIQFAQIAVVTKEEQEAHFAGCSFEQGSPNFCRPMPVSLRAGIPSGGTRYPDWFEEETGEFHRVYRFESSDPSVQYSLTSVADRNLINSGLSLRMTKLRPLADGDEMSCQGFVANIVASKNDEILHGTDDDDVIVVHGQNNIVYGGLGNDLICVNEGGSIVNGGPGDDEIYGSSKSEILIGAEGRDVIDAGNGADSVIGGPGADTLLGGAGNDTIRGLDGNDIIRGQSGRDVCNGGRGSDRVDGSCEIRQSAERR